MVYRTTREKRSRKSVCNICLNLFAASRTLLSEVHLCCFSSYQTPTCKELVLYRRVMEQVWWLHVVLGRSFQFALLLFTYYFLYDTLLPYKPRVDMIWQFLMQTWLVVRYMLKGCIRQVDYVHVQMNAFQDEGRSDLQDQSKELLYLCFQKR